MIKHAKLLAACLFAVLTATAPADAGEPEEAALVVTANLVNGAHSAMSAEDIDPDARAERLKQVITAAFAFDIWERFLVGDRNLTPDQLDEFRGLLPGFLAGLYANQFGNGLEGVPEISDARPVRRDILVGASIPRANGKTLPVEYRVRDFGERGALVIDVMVGGISFLVLKRDEFGGLIESRGVEALLAFMRENSI